ncbi:unnamed protein product [Medioppia subpectinata]|uniref:VWFA domain-containing protein n=1 Tax=Medioppia subpectinata TaxID=1979941 RepID=A0A7R9KBV9_9ACAR|nr:unnamed protein product [Medioppia subpectinata]CAG2100560.1 unnamed protein product [Medioppia subpectinata]
MSSEDKMMATIMTTGWPLVVALLAVMTDASVQLSIDPYEVRTLALRFGKDIYEGSAESTCVRKITSNFEDMKARVVWFDSNKMMEDMRNDVMNTLNWKKHAVETIANESQRLAANHTFDKNMELDYLNMKRLYDDRDGEVPAHHNDDGVEWKSIKLSPHPNFEGANVNLDKSAVHVPINVYERAHDIVNDIKWSEALTQSFKNNLAFDPGLSWQFFGSSRGFLRLYPATQWKNEIEFLELDTPPPDLYDCRLRPWYALHDNLIVYTVNGVQTDDPMHRYIQGAASPKDVIILLDSSGSMTGLRNSIAKNVISTILDTLTDDDYVSVMRFSDTVDYINKCFDNLVLANEKNIRQLKEDVANVRPTEVANFTAALTRAFDILQTVSPTLLNLFYPINAIILNRSKMGCQCNQAIMLITDGAPETYEDVFRAYNWPNIPVRVFTYLIGREVTDSQEVYWMACHNRGYYTHVSNLAEVREQVQQYVPVMSRPIVLSGDRVFAWTPVYAHVSEVPLDDWVWEEREKEIKNKLLQQRPLKRDVDSHSQIQENMPENDGKHSDNDNNEASGSASAPIVSDSLMNTEPEYPKKLYKPKKNITKRILVKNVYQDSEPETIRIANLLGVAGVDVPIKEIVKLTPAFKLGVNGYSFVTTNNGYLLYHPDLRPIFQDMLKPYYSSVDVSEVELADNTLGPRIMDDNINEIRGNMINRTVGWKKVKVKVHMDFKRVVTRVNHYIYGKIDFTPFSLAIVLPEPYGSYRVYCDSPHKMSAILPKSPEDGINQFLKTVTNGQNFRWKTSSTRPQVYETISCDKYLTQSLVFDAKATDIDASKCGSPNFSASKIDPLALLLALYPREQKLKMFGIVTTFVATRSGLTRFEDHRTDEEKKNSSSDTLRPFFDTYTKATEELYYRRAVDFHAVNDSAFVFSVPFDANQREGQLLVTGSHAIFLGTGKSSAPGIDLIDIFTPDLYNICVLVAVVGLQFKHSVFVERFINITTKYSKVICSAEEVDCYLLDNNGFIIYSENFVDTGKFFGEVDNSLMEAMVAKNVYRSVHFYDYQAICIKIMTPQSHGSILMTPMKHFKTLMFWMWSRIMSLYISIAYNSWVVSSQSDYQEYDDYNSEYGGEGERRQNNKTRPYPCDKEFDLYEMVSPLSEEPIKGDDNCGGEAGGCGRYGIYLAQECVGHVIIVNVFANREFTVQSVPYTNLVMVVVHRTCACVISTIKFEPKEVVYNSSHTCYLLKTELPRRRPTTCHNYHPQCCQMLPVVRESPAIWVRLPSPGRDLTMICGAPGIA